MVERQQDRLVKAIRTDRGGEFLSKDFSTWLKKQGIRHSLTMPYSPAMNGIAERANRTLTETARGLLIEAETYMEQPEGYNDGSGRVWKLKKALYGLKQAPRQWYIKLREVLEAIAFATGQLARVVQCPNEEQVAARERVAKYLGQTATVGLQYSAAAQRRQKGADGVEPGRLFLTAFSDASWASEPEDMTMELHYVKTTAQPADMMTKRLVEQQHWKCCKLAGMALN
ncbi:hypothetical protein CLOM_g23236 [Closterium sp. NIES-68]|nr:hypothetical protein CLOM_g23236 [Closterium sp. NIES-68]